MQEKKRAQHMRMVGQQHLHDLRPDGRQPASSSSYRDSNLKLEHATTSLSSLDKVSKTQVTTLGKYGILLHEMIGRGGQGSVFRASSPDGEVAVKMLRKCSGNQGIAQREQVVAEVKILQISTHNNVLRLIRWFEDEMYYYVVTELVEGQDLFDMAASHIFTENEILLICADVAVALEAMHARGVAHRDIKLENVLLAKSSFRAKLIDFGFACRLDIDEKEKVDGSSTQRGTPGTLKYQAPEILRRDASYNPARADMYALGIMAYILVCGEYPFGGDTSFEVAHAIRRGKVSFEHPVWKRVTTNAKMLILSLLSPVPEQRPSAAQVVAYLTMLMAGRMINVAGRQSQTRFKKALNFEPVSATFSSMTSDFKHTCAAASLNLKGLF